MYPHGIGRKSYTPRRQTPRRMRKDSPMSTGEIIENMGIFALAGGLSLFGGGSIAASAGLFAGPAVPIIGLIVYFTGPFLVAAGKNWPKHAPDLNDVVNYPVPDWLDRGLNIGFVGRTSSGKSSLINSMMGKRVAETGIGETTMKPTKYVHSTKGVTRISFFDCPGYGTKKYPTSNEYIVTMGLRYFSIVVLCIEDALSDLDEIMISHLKKNKIPFIVVRTKIDESFRNERRDHGKSKESTALELINDTSTKLSIQKDIIFLITNDPDEIERCHIEGFGWPTFMRTLENKTKEAYGFPVEF